MTLRRLPIVICALLAPVLGGSQLLPDRRHAD
jgi:hypothetical protein